MAGQPNSNPPPEKIGGAKIGEMLEAIAHSQRIAKKLEGVSVDMESCARKLVERLWDEVLKGSPTWRFSPDAWDKLPGEQQQAIYAQLKNIQSMLAWAEDPDGPTETHSYMFRKHASNRSMGLLLALAIIGIITNLWLIWWWWDSATINSAVSPAQSSTPGNALTIGQVTGPKETDVLCMIMLMGALGGFLHLASSLGKFIGNRQLLKSWIIYYVLMPFEGAAMACVVYLLLRVGVLMPAISNSGQATASLNLIGLYAFAALTGIFTEQALEALAEVFSTIFKRVEAKDPLEKSMRQKEVVVAISEEPRKSK